jgi:hypothetical protein
MKSCFFGLMALILSILTVAVPASAGLVSVPEPATGLLVALGIGAVMMLRRKNSKTPPEQ